MTAKEELESSLEWLDDNYDMSEDEKRSVIYAMIEFAKYHVKQALKSASEGIDQDKLDWEDFHDFSKGVTRVPNTSDIEFILNEAYPLENIK